MGKVLVLVQQYQESIGIDIANIFLKKVLLTTRLLTILFKSTTLSKREQEEADELGPQLAI